MARRRHTRLEHSRVPKLGVQCIMPVMVVVVALEAESARRLDIGKQIVDEESGCGFQAALAADDLENLAAGF